MRFDIAMLKQNMAILKENIAMLSYNIAMLKENMAMLGLDIARMSYNIAILRADIGRMRFVLGKVDYRGWICVVLLFSPPGLNLFSVQENPVRFQTF